MLRSWLKIFIKKNKNNGIECLGEVKKLLKNKEMFSKFKEEGF